jgi:hypothetical protein
MTLFLLGAVTGFVVGVLFGRRNQKTVETVVADAQAAAATVQKK